MSKMWFYLGLINLLIAIGVFIDQIVRFDVFWELEDMLHHETYVLVFGYGAVIFFLITLSKGVGKLIRRNQ